MSGKGITTDGEEVVLSTEDQAAAEAAQQEPQRQGATTMTTDVIRGMGDTPLAGGTMTASQVAREMERQQIYEVPDGQMLVRHPDGTLEPVPAADQPASGDTFIMYGNKTDRERPGVIGIW